MPLHAEQASLREYGQAEGLANLAVMALVRDSAGFIWVGTQNGAYRFDGTRFERIGGDEQIGYVTALSADGDRLWIGTRDGVWLWRDGTLQRVKPAGPAIGIRDPHAIAPIGDGRAWLASGGRLFEVVPAAGGWQRRDEGTALLATLPPELRSISAIARTPKGALWLGCGKAICRLGEGRVEVWGPERGVPAQTWRSLLLASDGSLWARGAHHALQLAPGANAFVDRAESRDDNDPFSLYPLAEDAQHRVISAMRGALIRWNGHAWERFDAAAGLPTAGRVLAALTDHEGGLWFGVMGAGLQQWRGYDRWQNWSVASGMPHNAVWSFARFGTPARLYAATGAGVAALDPASKRFQLVDGTARKETLALARDASGALWASTATGMLMQWPADRSQPMTTLQLPGSQSTFRLIPERTGRVWILDDASLHLWTPGGAATPQTVPITGGPLTDGCESRDGTLWFSSAAGVMRFASERWGALQRFDAEFELLACLSDGNLVVSSKYASLRLLRPDGDRLRADDITPSLLRGRRVLALLGDSRGWLWVATDAGVAVWNRRQWRLIGRDQGLVWNDSSSYALFEDEDASVWIGTSRGASHIVEPAALFDAAVRAPMIRAVSRAGTQLSLKQPLELPWSRDVLEIVLAVPAYRDRAAHVIEYRLSGFDERWIASPHPDIRLTGLPAGRYRFDARVVDRDLGVTSPATGFDFRIAPPWWETVAARVALAALAALLVYAAYRWRVRSLTRQEQRLQAQVQERTRELEASREMLREQATKDALTGVWNRRALMEILERELARCQREGQPLAVVLADIDHFKRVNDTHGHPAGDAVLRECAARLASALRPYDAVGRYGGEEFMLIMPGLDPARTDDRARLVAIHEAIASAPMSIGTVTCSFGTVGHHGTSPTTIDALIAAADQALYRAKRHGRNRVEYADTLGELSKLGVPPGHHPSPARAGDAMQDRPP
ncbi:ligand-binding sensor domain-containing diguanylate cyclase [Aquabacterium sp.]|uniref:ligand-binding sensor domain-containing diguanylate cyclase n=1 Tax=Aquabacterium sp. TaxID=1872578 RepID=UPI002D0514C2|nr:diguanylate cyclase [Aquabacterium sp.]HSW05650.1 diguanylate cyclase [Aquabacterium sp.]